MNGMDAADPPACPALETQHQIRDALWRQTIWELNRSAWFTAALKRHCCSTASVLTIAYV